MASRYAPIGEYGVIGDLYTVALVGMDGSTSSRNSRWLRSPREPAYRQNDRIASSRTAAINLTSGGCTAGRKQELGELHRQQVVGSQVAPITGLFDLPLQTGRRHARSSSLPPVAAIADAILVGAAPHGRD